MNQPTQMLAPGAGRAESSTPLSGANVMPGARHVPASHAPARSRARRRELQVASTEVARGVHRVDGTRVGNAYLVELKDGLLLVDTGLSGNGRRILAAVRELGRAPEDLQMIVLTHWHPDHAGSAAAVRAHTGARLAIHERDAEILAGRERPAKGALPMAIIDRLFGIGSVEPDVLLHRGDRIGGLEVIEAPGHTAGSIVLRRDDGVGFTGDAQLGGRHGEIVAPDRRLALDPTAALRSFFSIQMLSLARLLPGHGPALDR
jgi:glyoxylase-like metal-dependent hydrolase (beta-lactamase superfamily II)